MTRSSLIPKHFRKPCPALLRQKITVLVGLDFAFAPSPCLPYTERLYAQACRPCQLSYDAIKKHLLALDEEGAADNDMINTAVSVFGNCAIIFRDEAKAIRIVGNKIGDMVEILDTYLVQVPTEHSLESLSPEMMALPAARYAWEEASDLLCHQTADLHKDSRIRCGMALIERLKLGASQLENLQDDCVELVQRLCEIRVILAEREFGSIVDSFSDSEEKRDWKGKWKWECFDRICCVLS